MSRRSSPRPGCRKPRQPGALFLALIFIPPALAAQEPKPTGGAEKSTWYLYFGDHPISPSWAVHLEGQYRRQGIGQRWEQLLLRPGVKYTFGHGLSGMVAYTYFRNYPFEGGSLGDPTTTGPQPEHRLLEEFQVKHKLGGGGEKAIELAHRFRAEQRWQGTSTIGIGTTDWEFGERARYRLTDDIPFRWSTEGARPDYVSVYNEIFVNFGPHGGDNALDQNRTYGAVGWNLDKNFQIELGYLHNYMPTPSGVVGEHNHALQITINSTAPFRRGIRKKK